jgi:hypothetical protein
MKAAGNLSRILGVPSLNGDKERGSVKKSVGVKRQRS